jgi:NitT/TauT family transport system substrate-binding protein
MAMLLLGSLLAACAPGAAPASSAALTRPPATAPAPAAQVAAPTAAPPTSTARREPLHLDVGYVPSLVYAPLYVAYEKGYFRERGLDLTLEPGGGSPTAQVGAGNLQLAGIGLDAAYLNSRARGIDIRFVLPVSSVDATNASSTPLVVRKELADSGAVRGVADLRGRKVAQLGSAVGITYYLLALALETGGLDISDVDLVRGLNFPDMPQALAQGAIDAALLAEPFVTLSEDRGIVAILSDRHDVGVQVNGMVVSAGFAREHPDAVVDFAVAYLRAVRDLYGDGRNTPEHLAIVEQYTRVPAATVRRTRPSYTDPNGEFLLDSLMAQQRFFFTQTPLELPEPLPADQLVDPIPALRAVELLGPFRP